MRLAPALAAAALLTASLAAHADTTYTYTGQDFTLVHGKFTTSDSVTGFFTTATPLGANQTYTNYTPATFSFSDGIDTFTNAKYNSLFTGFNFATDANGTITQWNISAGTSGYVLLSIANGFQGGAGDGAGSGLVNQAENFVAGSFQSSTPAAAVTPEPSSIALLGTGLLGVAGIVRRRLA